MNTFYFNTGVKRYGHVPLVTLSKGQIWSDNGVKLIPFDCEDVPANAEFRFACSNPNLPEATLPCYLVREIHNSSLVSKYAYFFVRA